MRWIFLLVLVLVLAVPFAIAGGSADVDFSSQKVQPVYLYKGDEIRFTMFGQDNVLILKDVGSSSVKIALGLDVRNSTSTKLIPGLITLDYVMKVDVNKDGTSDLNIALYSVSKDTGLVNIVLQDISQAETSNSTNVGAVGATDSRSLFNKKNVLLGVVGILILALVAFLVFRGKKKKEHHAVHHHAEKKDEEVKLEDASPAGSSSEKSPSESDLE